MKGPSNSGTPDYNLRRSPRIANKRRASMSIIDDISPNQLLEIGKIHKNVVKKSKPAPNVNNNNTSTRNTVRVRQRRPNTEEVQKQFTGSVPIQMSQKENRKSPRQHEFKRPKPGSKSKHKEFVVPKLKRRKTKVSKSSMSRVPSSSHIDRLQNLSFSDYSTSTEKRMSRKRKARTDEDDMDDVDFPGLSASSSSSSLKRCREDGDDDMDAANVTLTGFKNLLTRRARDDDDNLSIQSFTMGYSNRRSRGSLIRVSSLANLISPVSSVKKVGQALQRSMSFRSSHSPSIYIKPYSKPAATPTKRRDSKLWSQTVTNNINEGLTKIEIKRQEAIFELYRGEVDLVEDLQLILKTYRDSMKSLGILNQQELATIFFRLEELVPLHEDLIERLERLKQDDGRTDAIGKEILEWLPDLTDCYTSYCVNQLTAKSLLDEKKQDKRVQDFLERCQESPFSRKLDLWNFLDVPRSRLVKYPLLLRNILRLTSTDHEDKRFLGDAIQQSETIIKEVDKSTGEQKCQYYIKQLEYLDDSQCHPLISEQKSMHCMGILRNNKGSKLHTFLFEDILVVTRIATRNGVKSYQVTRMPIPIRTLHLEDVPEGELRTGSFRGAFSSNQSGKHAFRVTSTDPDVVQSFTFITSDEHDKKQWMQMIRQAISLCSSKDAVAD